MENRLIVSSSPHILAKDTTSSIMRDVLIALLPAVAASVIFFGFRALLIEVVCVAACILSEFIFQKICKRRLTIGDLSAAVTGLLLALNLPVALPLWQAVVGSIFAIIVIKQLFGGIGQNFANPAITARIIMLIAFAGPMTTWVSSGDWIAVVNPTDVVTSATPLAAMGGGEGGIVPSLLDMFLGNRGGCIGETSIVALLIGGIYLMARRVISWHTPVTFIATVFLLTSLYGGSFEFGALHMMAGGLFIGAFFMATDYSTTPTTAKGRIVFGIGCGLITVVIRLWGSYPEGVSFSILLMNILTPYISMFTANKPLGGVKA